MPSQEHPEVCFANVLGMPLNPIKLTIKINHHTFPYQCFWNYLLLFGCHSSPQGFMCRKFFFLSVTVLDGDRIWEMRPSRSFLGQLGMEPQKGLRYLSWIPGGFSQRIIIKTWIWPTQFFSGFLFGNVIHPSTWPLPFVMGSFARARAMWTFSLQGREAK
jgi:hypothetical protein